MPNSKPKKTQVVDDTPETSNNLDLSPEVLEMLDERYSRQSPSKLLILLLVAVSFFAGYLLKKVNDQDVLAKNTAGANTQQAAQNTQQGEDLGQLAKNIAKDIGLDTNKFNSCVDGKKYDEKINAQLSEGSSAGIQATPSNVVYDTQTGNAILIEGALPYEALKQAYEDFKNGTNQEQARAITVAAPDPENAHWRGPKDARYVWIEYSDLECPFCKRAHPDIVKLTNENKDEMAWEFRHYPLSFHPYAQTLANSVECANEQKGSDAFWQMVDRIYSGA